MDGNRRFAKSINLNSWRGHEYGERKLREVLEWCEELGFREVTLYAFSTENFGRPKKELKFLMNLFNSVLENLINDEKFLKKGVKVNILGNLNLFNASIQNKFNKLIKLTTNNNKLILNIALGYGGREEILQGVKKICEDVLIKKIKPEDINEKTFENYLQLKSNPELIIRTGGEFRTSNFLPWQSTYSEWFFIEKLWPEIEKKDLQTCLKEFKKRQRRYGK